MVRRPPYRQGHLDSLCGVYAVLNAIDLVHPLDFDEAWNLFHRLLHELERRGALADAIAGGITGSMVWRLVNIAAEYLCEEEGVRLAVDRPFRNRRFASAEDFFDELRLELVGGRAAIICIAGRFELAHWTVIRGVTQHTIQLRDSAGMRYLRWSGCRVGRTGAPDKPVILPAATVVLTV